MSKITATSDPIAFMEQQQAEIERLRAALEYLRGVLQEIEDAYDDRTDEKLDFEQVRERAGYALEFVIRALRDKQS